MKSIKLFNLIVTLSVMLLMLAACETDLPEACPDAQFTVNVNGDSTEYTITADFEGIEDLVYGWYVNDDLVETEGLDEKRNNTFDFNFQSGTYTVCIKAESAECGGSIEFCQEVVIKRHEGESDCPELSFEKQKIEHEAYKYLFEANFHGKDTLFYVWYVDGDSVESESLDGDRHHKFDYTFEPGEHKVCIIANTDRCGELAFCKEFVVEEWSDDCPTPEFTKEADGDFAYWFTATFGGKDTTQYKWYINGEFVDKENFDGHDTNHNLYWQFDPGTYTICIETVANDHCEAREYCKTITIEGEHTGCPDPHFGYKNLGENEYKFYAEFGGQEGTQYKWLLDGVEVDVENFEGTVTDHKYIQVLEPGTYSMCLITIGTDNCDAAEYCQSVTVEEVVTDCVELSYTADPIEGGYKFTADFEHKDHVTYIWKVFINDDFQEEEVRLAGSDDDHEFILDGMEPGVVYEVCLKQDGCAEAIICNTYSID